MIKLVTISRISKEKGFGRMLQLEAMLKAAGISFIWDCYGDTSTRHARQIIRQFKYVKFKGITKAPQQVMRQYDYLVQLSDTEGFPYSIYEAMQVMVPVIATDFPSVHEMITDGVNGYILKMDLSNFNTDKIKTIPVIKSFREKSNEKDWINFLDMATKRTAKPRASRKPKAKIEGDVTLRVTRKYFDVELNVEKQKDETFEASPKRAKVLVNARVAAIISEPAPESPSTLSAVGL